jgi:hypothetical protein
VGGAGLGFRIWGVWFRVYDLGRGIWGLRLRLEGSWNRSWCRSGVEDLGWMVKCVGLRV